MTLWDGDHMDGLRAGCIPSTTHASCFWECLKPTCMHGFYMGIYVDVGGRNISDNLSTHTQKREKHF
jgi:hypothetical protein